MAETFSIDLVKDSTLEKTNAILSLIAAGKNIKPKTYDDIQAIVQLGLAPQVFSIGDILEYSRVESVTAALGAHTGISSATVDQDKFIKAMNEAGNIIYEITFNGSTWKYKGRTISLNDCGISTSGTPQEGDTIVITEKAVDLQSCVCDFIDNGKKGSIKIKDNSKKYGMIMQNLDCYDAIQFDEREAFYYASEEMPAGTYYFTVETDVWASNDNGKSFCFTTTQTIPQNAQLVTTNSYNVTYAGANVKIFSSGASTEPLEVCAISEGENGTFLGTLKAAVNGNLNSYQRAKLGSNKWSESAIRKILNSSMSIGKVWTQTGSFDRLPSYMNTKEGFMKGLDPAFLKICAEVEIETVLNIVSDTTSSESSAGTGYEKTIDTFFLPSRSEVYAGKENNSDTGEAWSFYKNNSDSSSASTNNDSNRIKRYISSGAAVYWWLRAPYVGNSSSPRRVDPSGNGGTGNAIDTHGAAPAYVIA